jgi:hypothetical protein
MTESNTRTGPVRGLEWQTPQGALRHEHNKLMARVAVLNEQYRQFLDGEQDDELVADAYLNVSIHCCDEAHWMGLKDEAAINNELKEIIMKNTSNMTTSLQSFQQPRPQHRHSIPRAVKSFTLCNIVS